jgi:hypothetical protein
VCATYPWSSVALVFADGSAHWTALAPSIFSSFVPGKIACSTGFLNQQGAQCGICADAAFDFDDSFMSSTPVSGTAASVLVGPTAVLEEILNKTQGFNGSDLTLSAIIHAADVLIMRKL